MPTESYGNFGLAGRPTTLTRTTEVGVSWWQGRWEIEVGGWKLIP